jgi:very-short-patch-repair endonuclease
MVYKSRNYDDNLHLGADGKRFSDARLMRKDPTNAESILWHSLKNRKLEGYKFRRQHPILHFIADFYCHEAKLIIEVDGEYHQTQTQKERDDGRTYELGQYDIKILRFKNEDIHDSLEAVLDDIKTVLANK